MARVIHGTIAAAVTPFTDGGDAIDTKPVAAYVDLLAAGGGDGLLVLGTTGEGILLAPEERKRVAECFVAAAPEGVAVAVHCGAQTTADTMELARHAAELGADGVAVIGPPYFAFDEEALFLHFARAAAACAPTPFYLYEFAARSGYSVPVAVIERLRDAAPNLRGLKVSDSPWERFAPYLLEGLDVFVGPEALICEGLAHGCAGAVSGLAAAFPEAVAREVAAPTERGSAALGALRAAVQRTPFQATLKRVLARRGLPIREDVRAPLRRLTDRERSEVDSAVAAWLESSSVAPAR
jgi:dihydrodipicolinate synthase/N-acetylneuraminate lyase